jgi:trigger factor
MEITKKAVDPYLVDAHITLNKEELAAYVAEVSDHLAEHVTVEGFRKGKAPKGLAAQNLDERIVRQEALELALQDSFTKAASQEQWDVMHTSELKVLKNDADALEYSVQVALWPVVTLPDLATVRVTGRKIEVADSEIEESLDTVRNMRATFLDKVGPAAIGDRCEVDFDSAVAGTPVPGGSSRNHPLIIGGKSFMPGFEEELVGLEAGAKKEFSLVAPADYYEPSLAGKKVDFTVTVNRVQTVLKPAADDAFVKSLGRFEDLNQLKAGLSESIAAEKKQKEGQRIRLAILDAIVAAGTVPAPAAMVKDELDQMLQRFGNDLKGRGIELSMYLSRLKKTEEDLRTDWKKEAERQVRITLVLREVARSQQISIAPDELERTVKETIGEIIRSGQAREDQIDPERVRSALAQRMLADKTLDFLERTCAVNEA